MKLYTGIYLYSWFFLILMTELVIRKSIQYLQYKVTYGNILTQFETILYSEHSALLAKPRIV